MFSAEAEPQITGGFLHHYCGMLFKKNDGEMGTMPSFCSDESNRCAHLHTRLIADDLQLLAACVCLKRNANHIFVNKICKQRPF